MSFDDLPTRRPNDPPIPGPHRIVGEEGITHHVVFAGPNTWPKPTKQPLIARIGLRVLDWIAVPVGIVAGAFLAMAWGSLDDKARIAVATLTLLAIAGHLTIRRTRRRKVRN
jgi:hypothetical protein